MSTMRWLVKYDKAADALREIAAIQPRRVEWFREHGIVFDSAPRADGDRWQNIAFAIYTDLCEAESIASNVLKETA